MYESYFELRVKPFELLPDPKFIYLSKSHKKALTYLDYGIRERAGFILLTGEVGSGKTTLIRNLLDKHYEHTVLSKIFNTRATSEQLLAMINDDFGLPTQGKDKVSLIRDLNGFLVDQYARGNQPILIIDEAQNLAPDLLEEVRMLSNLETSDSKLLQIILVGQPEMRKILSAPELRQLRQRISINCHLQALGREETELYIAHRLEVAGNASAVDFSPESLDVVFRYSKGIPRLINIICDFLMLSAFAEETKAVSVEMVRDVIGDLDFDNHYWSAAAVAEEGGRLSDGTFSHGLETLPRSLEIQRVLDEISRRIESIENNITIPPHTALKDYNAHFESLLDNVAAHVVNTDLRVSDLSRKLEKIMMTVERGDVQVAPHDPTRVGFVRRVFGGDTMTKRKK